mmetsp:Transcript_99260/g.280262  ORF Transcript_99260/g.280262 Transcript_99260/m.280262 type:complete len:87 (+) Transcript_99260:95-355(+)
MLSTVSTSRCSPDEVLSVQAFTCIFSTVVWASVGLRKQVPRVEDVAVVFFLGIRELQRNPCMDRVLQVYALQPYVLPSGRGQKHRF